MLITATAKLNILDPGTELTPMLEEIQARIEMACMEFGIVEGVTIGHAEGNNPVDAAALANVVVEITAPTATPSGTTEQVDLIAQALNIAEETS